LRSSRWKIEFRLRTNLMPFDWNEFLRLAEELAVRADDASRRSAISRAYYSVYHRANPRVVANCGPRPSGTTAHKWCWDKYQQTSNSACKSLGLAGDRMKRRRHEADYRDNIYRLEDVVRTVLDEARRFPADLDALDARYPCP